MRLGWSVVVDGRSVGWASVGLGFGVGGRRRVGVCSVRSGAVRSMASRGRIRRRVVMVGFNAAVMDDVGRSDRAVVHGEWLTLGAKLPVRPSFLY